MRITIFAVAVTMAFTSCIAARAAQPDDADVIKVVNEYLADMNQGAADTFVRLCSPQTIIIDDFPPHTWQGPTACMDWLTAFAAYDAKAGITPRAVTIGKPWRVSVNGENAYVVVPATYTYTKGKKKVTEANSVWTLALRKGPDGWRIAGWAWGQR
ncbi:nuclear transport factor 2 family protein [Xanthobacter tagetidis]|jgi:ketosteroid isomerase-like protein|nr:nuclear transport factor 2 family protein [Xanthobacter tagetidis]MBB6306368.1 ketosteroid isomerase-like protein [Xanthobacter tagetidis]